MTAINKIIESPDLYSLDEYGCHFKLEDEQTIFIKGLLQEINENKIFQTFRGESLSRLSDKFKTYDFISILNYFFLVGDKAAIFFKENVEENLLEIENLISKLSEREVSSHLTNVNFDKIRSYFLGREYKIINYYSRLLHILEKFRYPERSHLYSTSPDYDVAKDFSHNKNRTVEGVILFVVKPKKKFYELADLDEIFIKQLEEGGLPIIHQIDFFGEDEITFQYGLYPHCIFAIQHNCTNQIFINPSLLKYMKDEHKISSFLHTCEIDVDQSKFEEKLFDTNFKSYVKHNDDQYRVFNRGD